MTDKRFKKVYAQGAINNSEIWVDTQTGVQYFYHNAGYGAGLTVLVDAEGKPLLYHRSVNGPDL